MQFEKIESLICTVCKLGWEITATDVKDTYDGISPVPLLVTLLVCESMIWHAPL